MVITAALVVVVVAVATAAAATPPPLAPAADVIKVEPASGHFVDQHGRRRVFHGVNAVYKVPPYIPRVDVFDANTSLADVDIANLQRWGFNVVRLGVMWPGWMPSADAGESEAYKANMLRLVKRLAAAGLYTLVDMHQDLLSRKLCGEGAPDWAVAYPGGEFAAPFPLPVAAPYAVNATTHYPALERCLSTNFAYYYVADAVQETFQQLYENYGGMQDALVHFWGNVSTAFAGVPGVLGYEIINEPWPGNAVRHPHLLEPGAADREHLAPLYERVAAAVRAADPTRLVFFEKALVPGQVLPSGFAAGPGGDAQRAHNVLSYHVYCAPVDHDGVPRNVLLCNGEDLAEFEVDYRDARRLGVGAMLTEFGAMLNAERAIDNLHYLTSLADTNFQSWSYWQFKYFGDLTTQGGAAESFYLPDGTLEASKVRALARTYAQAVSGEPLRTSFNPATGDFELRFRLDTRIALAAPTVIFYSAEYYYPAGANVTVLPAHTLRVRELTPGFLEFGTDRGSINGTVVDIRITPK